MDLKFVSTVVNAVTKKVNIDRLAIHLSRNTQKLGQNAKKKCMVGYFTPLFSRFTSLFSHFAPGSAFTRKVKGFRGLFFCGINKTWNSHEMWKCIVSVPYFVVCFAKNTREMQKVYNRPYRLLPTAIGYHVAPSTDEILSWAILGTRMIIKPLTSPVPCLIVYANWECKKLLKRRFTCEVV